MRNTQQLKDWLVSQGYTGSVNSALRSFLSDEGYTKQLSQAYNEWLGDQGYTGNFNLKQRQFYDVVLEGGDPLFINGLDNGDYETNATQITISGLGSPYDGTYSLPTEYSDPGYIVAPFITGTPGVGNTLTINQGISYSESETTTCTYTLKRGGVAFLSDQPFDLDHTTDVTYTQLTDDKADGGVTIEITLDDGDSTSLTELTIVAPEQPAIVSSAPVSGTAMGDLLSDGRTWTLYEIPNTGLTDLTGSFGFSRVGVVYAALVGGGEGGSNRQYGTAETNFGGEGGCAGEVTDWTKLEVLSATENYTVGGGGAGAPNSAINNRGSAGNDTTFLGLTASGGAYPNDGSGTYTIPASPSGWNTKSGGAGAGSDGYQATGQFTPAGDGGDPKTIVFGSLSRTYGYGGGASNMQSSTAAVRLGGAGNGALGAGQGYGHTAGVFVPAADGEGGTGSGGGGSCGWATEPLSISGDGGGGRLMLLVEDA